MAQPVALSKHTHSYNDNTESWVVLYLAQRHCNQAADLPICLPLKLLFLNCCTLTIHWVCLSLMCTDLKNNHCVFFNLYTQREGRPCCATSALLKTTVEQANKHFVCFEATATTFFCLGNLELVEVRIQLVAFSNPRILISNLKHKL